MAPSPAARIGARAAAGARVARGACTPRRATCAPLRPPRTSVLPPRRGGAAELLQERRGAGDGTCLVFVQPRAHRPRPACPRTGTLQESAGDAHVVRVAERILQAGEERRIPLDR